MNDNYNTYLGKAYRFLTFDGLFKTVENQSLRLARVDLFIPEEGKVVIKNI